jgi:GNAT superfamily N-acetyltransferase
VVSRSAVHIRAVHLDDAEELLAVWQTLPPRLAAQEQARAEVEGTIRKVLASERERIVVAEVGDRLAGALHLKIVPLAPLSSDLAVFTSHLNVVPEFRKRGIARGLMESAVTWAEENAIVHVVAMSAVNSRDTSRFMARLGLAQAAVVRVAPTATLRAKLPVDLPGVSRPVASNRQIGQVLAARRSLRRNQSVS